MELQVVLADGRTGNATFSPMNVRGSAPTITSLSVVSPTTTPIYEGTAVTVRTTAADTRDPIGLTYLWELQLPGQTTYSSIAPVSGAPTDLKFTPNDDGIYRVRVTVKDSQGLFVQQVLPVTIANADPTGRIDAIYNSASPNTITLNAIVTDPGANDIPDLRYSWSINGGVYSAPSTNSQFPTTLSGLMRAAVRVTDGDGGVLNRSFYVLQGTNGNDVFTIDANVVAASGNADQILYLGLNGDDQITVANVAKKVVVIGGPGKDRFDASATTLGVLLDGSDGDDTLIGGSGDDILIAGTGKNTLFGGNGNNRFIGGGSDTMTGGTGADYYDVHFSDVVINDTAGGYDTIDLTRAQAGITLNLSNNTGAPQTVFPAALWLSMDPSRI